MGFTVDPVVEQEGGAKVVHAPVAVSGLAIAFFVESPSGVIQDMKLTPRLVAKMLTHSYVRDVPWSNICNVQGESCTAEHLKGNPLYYTKDPEFLALNPDFEQLPGGQQPMSLMVPITTSDTTRVIWNWLQSDREARDFLSGKPDPFGMRVNPYFQDLDLAENSTLTDFPKVDPTTTRAIGAAGDNPLTYTLTDLDPYSTDLHDGAVKARRGNNGSTTFEGVDANTNQRKLVNIAPTAGQRTVMAVVDAASAVRYGLQTAALRNADGKFVKPSTSTMLKGVEAMRPWSGEASVLKADPARAKGQAYPLTAVTYAMASVNQDAAARKAYAQFIRYASGPGQTPGLSAGELPPGYAPLPAKLRTQARNAAAALERGVPGQNPSPDPERNGSGGGLAGGADSGGTSSGSDGGGASGGAAGGDTGGTDTSASESPGPNGSPPPSSGPVQNVAEAKGGITPGDILGIIRWVLLAVLFMGGAAGLAGPAMLRFAHRRTP
ncbi:hypothetical protein [Streptomyces sp. 4N124]|uniref:hypothetical protein n=1 Tax=Streptomyces sp. 4N124 TaxID=3457420 RepID=UPI003FD078C4